MTLIFYYLAFTPPEYSTRSSDVNAALAKKIPFFYDRNYEILEFYGDTVLYMIIIELFRQFNGLRRSLTVLNELKQEKTKNVFLRALSHSKKICDTVFDTVPTHHLPLHNRCTDSFEALFGALYFQYGPTGIPKIVDWYKDVFPEVVNDIWLKIVPSVPIPVPVVIEDDEDIAARFTSLIHAVA